MKPGTRVFVYGTLRMGGSNHARMRGARFVGPAEVRGRLYRVGAYPGLILDETAGGVSGEVYEVDDNLLAELDAFEGDEYERVGIVPVMTGGPGAWDEDAGRASLWHWRGGVDDLLEIEGGDWIAFTGRATRPWWTMLGCTGLLALPVGTAMIFELATRPFPMLWDWMDDAMLLAFVAAAVVGFMALIKGHRSGEMTGGGCISAGFGGLLAVGSVAAALGVLLGLMTWLSEWMK